MIVLGIENFDIILGMNWLSGNHITVNCRERQIIVNSLGKEPVVCFEDTMVMPVPIMLAMKVLTLLMKGRSSYMAYMMDDKEAIPALEEMLVVKDFPEIFLEELSGLPSQC